MGVAQVTVPQVSPARDTGGADGEAGVTGE